MKLRYILIPFALIGVLFIPVDNIKAKTLFQDWECRYTHIVTEESGLTREKTVVSAVVGNPIFCPPPPADVYKIPDPVGYYEHVEDIPSVVEPTDISCTHSPAAPSSL